MSIKHKVIAITGAGSGIGRATAILLASHGAFVVLGGRNKDALKAVADDIAASGGKAAYSSVDVRNRQEVEAFVGFAVDAGGRLDVIINNAGIGPISRFDALRVEDWDAMIDVNLRGTLHGIAAALPVFARQASGHVINVVSTAGIKMVPTMGVYAATKNAIRTATEILRQESGPAVRVTEVSPGVVATNFSDSMTEEERKRTIEHNMEQMGLPPAAIARGILYAIEQPPEVEVGSIVIRPAAQA